MSTKVFRLILALSALSLAVTLAGCGGQTTSAEAQKLLITATNDLKYQQQTVTVKAGTPVLLTLENSDSSVLHDFNVQKIKVKGLRTVGGNAEHKHDAATQPAQLHLAAAPGKAGTLEFTPQEPGTYTFYCSLPGHKEAGMIGTLRVEPGA